MELNLGKVRGEQGIPGAKGDPGQNGADGFSPTIVVEEDTETSYKLTITTADGSFTTPNLKGQNGEGGGGSGVTSFNDRTGDVMPSEGDYTAKMVGAATMSQVNTAIQDAILDSWGASY